MAIYQGTRLTANISTDAPNPDARFVSKTTQFMPNGDIRERYADGSIVNTKFNEDGTITETRYEATGLLKYTKVTEFLENGDIKETVTEATHE